MPASFANLEGGKVPARNLDLAPESSKFDNGGQQYRGSVIGRHLSRATTTIIDANRKTTFGSAFVVVLCVLAAAVSSTVVVYTRPLSAGGKNHTGVLSDAQTGMPVSTGQTTLKLNLLSNLNKLGPNFNYLDVETLKYTTQDGAVHGHRITSYTYYNSTDLDLVLTDDRTIMIVDGKAYLRVTSSGTMLQGVERRQLMSWEDVVLKILLHILIHTVIDPLLEGGEEGDDPWWKFWQKYDPDPDMLLNQGLTGEDNSDGLGGPPDSSAHPVPTPDASDTLGNSKGTGR